MQSRADAAAGREPPAPAAEAERRAPATPAAALLARQRAAGNRATGALARRALARAGPSDRPPPSSIPTPGQGRDGLWGTELIGRSLTPEQARVVGLFRQWLESTRDDHSEWGRAAGNMASKHAGTGEQRAALYAELQRQMIQVDSNWYARVMRGADDEWVFLSKPRVVDRTFIVRADGSCWTGPQAVLADAPGQRLKVAYDDPRLFALNALEKPPGAAEAEAGAFGLHGQADRGSARGLAIIAVLTGLLEWLKGKADTKEQAAIAQELDALSARIREHQAGAPQDGALVQIVTRRTKLRDAPVEGPEKLAYVKVGYGRTESEARLALAREAAAGPGLGANELLATHAQWVEPVAPSSPAELRPPFPRVAAGGIRGTTLTLQNVKWDSGGFDDEDQAQVAFAAEQDARFSILRVPVKLAGQAVPVEASTPREGPAVPSVDLDPGTPFADVHAVAVFPDNDLTRKAFERAPATLGTAALGGLPNLELVRWIRPEHLRVLDGAQAGAPRGS